MPLLAGCVGDEARLACPSGLTACGTSCVDADFDPENCGSCGQVCPGGQVCSIGQCGTECLGGTARCGDRCVDLANDPLNCGDCDIACAADEPCAQRHCGNCAMGMTSCDGACVDTQVDPAHCGSCTVACMAGEVCSAGQCATGCAGGTTECGGMCVSTDTDEDHCGGCDAPCAADQLCIGGGCRLPVGCLEILGGGGSPGDGVYLIDPNGADPTDAVAVYCDMSADGGGWTLIAKTNGNDQHHFGTDPMTVSNLTSVDLSSSGYIGDANRLAIGSFYRVTCWGATRFAYVTNTLSFSQWWGQPNMGVGWNPVFSSDPAAYVEPANDDCSAQGSCVSIGYEGRNWANNGANGCRILGIRGYGGSGLMFVK